MAKNFRDSSMTLHNGQNRQPYKGMTVFSFIHLYFSSSTFCHVLSFCRYCYFTRFCLHYFPSSDSLGIHTKWTTEWTLQWRQIHVVNRNQWATKKKTHAEKKKKRHIYEVQWYLSSGGDRMQALVKHARSKL